MCIKTYDNFVNENIKFSEYKEILSNIKKELNLNLFFISTFGTSIVVFLPLIESISKKSELINLTNQDLILLSIYCISVMLKESKSDIKTLMNNIKEKGLIGVYKKIKFTIDNILYLFSKVCTYFGKSIITLIDMFSYVALLVPFSEIMMNLIYKNDIDITKLNNLISNPEGFIISTTIGITTITLKHVISFIVNKLSD